MLVGGTEGVGLLAASVYVRELLLKPLGFRATSLARYVREGSGEPVASQPGPLARCATLARSGGAAAAAMAAAAAAAAVPADDVGGELTQREAEFDMETAASNLQRIAAFVHDTVN